MKYSFPKGLLKGLVSLFAVGGGILTFTGLADIEIWALAEEYIKPILGSLTIGGAITVLVNYIKVKTKSSV